VRGGKDEKVENWRGEGGAGLGGCFSRVASAQWGHTEGKKNAYSREMQVEDEGIGETMKEKRGAEGVLQSPMFHRGSP